VAHSLFGMLDSDSEAFYNQKMYQLEELAEVDPRTDYCCSVHLEICKQNPTRCIYSELILAKELDKILNFVNVGNEI